MFLVVVFQGVSDIILVQLRGRCPVSTARAARSSLGKLAPKAALRLPLIMTGDASRRQLWQTAIYPALDTSTDGLCSNVARQWICASYADAFDRHDEGFGAAVAADAAARGCRVEWIDGARTLDDLARLAAGHFGLEGSFSLRNSCGVVAAY